MPGDLHRPGPEPGPFRRTHQHDLGRFVEHHPHHLVSAPRYRTRSVSLARLILSGCQPEHRPDRLGVPEAGRYIDRDAIGQRDHRTDPGDRHQAPAHLIVSDNGQHAAMQDAELLANNPPDNKQRLDQDGQLGKLLDKLRASNFTVPAMPTLRPKLRKVARRSFSIAIAFDCSSLRWVSSIRSFWLRSVFTCTGR